MMEIQKNSITTGICEWSTVNPVYKVRQEFFHTEEVKQLLRQEMELNQIFYSTRLSYCLENNVISY